MSQISQPLDMLPLFAEPTPPAVKAVHDAAELEHAAFFDRVRRLVAGHYAGSGIRISMDDVHRILDRYGIKLPAGASPNIWGSFFAGWSRAKSTGTFVRSKRDGSNGNLIAEWLVT